MGNRINRSILALITLAFYLSACTSATSPTPALPTQTNTPPAIDISVLTPSVTRNPLPSPSIALTQSPILALIPETPFVSPPPEPTLTSEERADYFIELLQYNSSCLLPCWWRVIPGQTSWEETLQFLTHLGVVIGNTPTSSGRIFHRIGGVDLTGLSIYNSGNFIENNGLVDAITIHSEGYYNFERFNSIWEDYSLEKILTIYGQPTRVWVQSFNSPHEPPADRMMYSLWVFYDDLGFLIKYSGSTEYASVYNICPLLSSNGNIGGIDVAIESAGYQMALEYLAGRMGSPASIKTIEEATGNSVETFYNLFIDENGGQCFETPRDIYP
jgi:hypothetical protein